MRLRALASSTLPLALCMAGAAHAQSCPAVNAPLQGAPIAAPLPVFPADNWWNTDISGAPVDANSANFINFIGAARRLHPDFGGEADLGSQEVYGFPYIVVNGAQAKLPVTFDYWDESDGVNMSNGQGVPFYPIPSQVTSQQHWMEGGAPGSIDQRDDNDRHILIVDCTNRTLYELYNAWYSNSQQRWYAGSGAFFDLQSNARRPESWTSADAAGLAIFPGLVRYDEAANPNVAEIGHAFRVTVRTSNGHVYPASHTAGGTSGALPMGARLRLKKNVNGTDPATRTTDPVARKIFRAMQTYGLIVADNGSDMYISGTFDVRWNNGALNPAFNGLQASDFEVVQLGWKPVAGPSLSIDDASVSEGDAGTKVLRFTVRLSAAATSNVTVSFATSNGTALAGSDYVAANGSLTFAPGQTTRTFDVAINGDLAREANETFQVALSNPNGATLADATALGTILTDDGPRTGGPGQKTPVPPTPKTAPNAPSKPIRMGEHRYTRYPERTTRGE
ncbi:hypothetical protein LF41_2983 [Lysobacter dokdonensis DS-58]|uniref:Calx-beta domain-containing protein n=1 Tax=Lysobacter dokdonensis DS-58 TaxID=1300345 RepID=A0A0A2WHP3_9GAMM|nr:Calx-beta domain-containing protein [Lysobacter dokdonensis]KGQ19333.1 hypothetical protein LF41_2983 [Lysobacter dokdonensis DS-58]